MRQLDPGRYDGKIVDYGMSKTKAGDSQAFIMFNIEKPEGGSVELTWYGSLNPKPKEEGGKAPSEWTIATLLDCGFSSSSIEILAAGKDGNSLEVGKMMTLSVQDNVWDGNTTSQIRFVNILGSTPGPKRVSVDDACKLPESGALRAQLLRARAGATAPKSPL
jgi:hypothetical protein